MRICIVLAAALALAVAQTARADEIKLLASGATQEIVQALLPAFEKSTGHKITATWTGTVKIKEQIDAGAVYDLVIVGAPRDRQVRRGGKACGWQPRRYREVRCGRGGQGRRAEARHQFRRGREEGDAGGKERGLFDGTERRLRSGPHPEIRNGRGDQAEVEAKRPPAQRRPTSRARRGRATDFGR